MEYLGSDFRFGKQSQVRLKCHAHYLQHAAHKPGGQVAAEGRSSASL